MNEDDIINRIKDLQQCSDAEIQEMLICSLVDDLVELEGKREEPNNKDSPNLSSESPQSTVSGETATATTGSSNTEVSTGDAGAKVDSNDLLGKMLSGTDPKSPKENDEFVKMIYNIIFEKYGGKDIIEFEGVVEKKEEGTYFFDYICFLSDLTNSLSFYPSN